MATLSALKFSTPEGAQQMANLLADWQKQGLILVVDAAVVSWPVGINIRKTHRLHNLAGPGALNGTFWGMLFCLIFFIPPIGATTMGALAGAAADVGIDDEFIQQAHNKITEGTSALFLLADKVALDKVTELIKNKGIHFELITSSLSQEQEAKLSQVFAA
jgi:uncharacterized membrane protein